MCIDEGEHEGDEGKKHTKTKFPCLQFCQKKKNAQCLKKFILNFVLHIPQSINISTMRLTEFVSFHIILRVFSFASFLLMA